MIGTSTVAVGGTEGPAGTTMSLEGAQAGVAPPDVGGSQLAQVLQTLEVLPALQALQVSQVTVEGGSTPVVLAAVVAFFVATVLAVLVTYRFVEGYRRTRAQPILLLAVGMFLLAPAPMFIRLLAGNVEPVPLSAQLLLTTLSELCGLLAILYVVYTQ